MILLNIVKCVSLCVSLGLYVDAATFPPEQSDTIQRDANYVISSLNSQDKKLVEMLKDAKNFQSSEEVNKYFDELAYFNKCLFRLQFLVYAHVKEYSGIFADLILRNGPDILREDLLSNDARKKYWLNNKKTYETAIDLISITHDHWNKLKQCFPPTPMPRWPTYYMKPFTDNY